MREPACLELGQLAKLYIDLVEFWQNLRNHPELEY